MEQSPYIERHPHAALRPWIETYWSFAVAADASAGIAHRVLPDLASDIIYDMGAVQVPSFGGDAAKVIGVMTTAKVSTMVPGLTLLGVRFKPYAAAAVLKMPASEVKDQDPSLADLGMRHFDISDQLCEFNDNEARFAHLDKLFLARMGRFAVPNPALLTAVSLIAIDRGNVTVEALAAATNQSRRHLTRTFSVETGLTTKEFLRISRLRACLPQIEEVGGKPDWAELAQVAGFYDQAHFVCEFGRIVGLTPQQFWQEARLKR